MQSLNCSKINQTYVIKKIEIKNQTVLSRLKDFEIFENQIVKTIAKGYGNKSILVSVNAVEYAIDMFIAKQILVEAI